MKTATTGSASRRLRIPVIPVLNGILTGKSKLARVVAVILILLSMLQPFVPRVAYAANANSSYPILSPDGRWVAFLSAATDLGVSPGTYNVDQVYLRDRQTGAIQLISANYRNSGGGNIHSGNEYIQVTPNGKFVAFDSGADNLVVGDTNNQRDIFVRDVVNRTTTRISVAPDGSEIMDVGGSWAPQISDDGTLITFQTQAKMFGSPTISRVHQGIYLRDLVNKTTTLVSVDMPSQGGTGIFDCVLSSISGDGRYVVFTAAEQKKEGGYGPDHIYRRDLQTGTTVQVDTTDRGERAVGFSQFPTISRDGRRIAFRSNASNFPQANGTTGLYVKDLETGMVWRADVKSSGLPAD